MYGQIRRRSQLEISTSGTSTPTTGTSIRIVVEGSCHDVDDHSSSEVAAISRKLSSRISRQQRDCDMMTTALPTTGVLEVNTGSSSVAGVEALTPNVNVTTEELPVFFCHDVTGTCRSDRDDISVSTFSHADAVSPGLTGSRPVDNSSDMSITTPTSCREDNDEVRVRFRFDSVSCAAADQKGVASCPLPKEPHPVRDQTVRRHYGARDDSSPSDSTRPEECRNNMRLSLPPTAARRLHRTSSEYVEEDRREAAAPRLRWLFRRRARGRQREKPSSALRKEIKAARQLGVIMGAFTVCFFVSAGAPTRQPSSSFQETVE